MKYKKEIKIKSALPVYLAGASWIVCALFFPLYKWQHLIFVALLSIAVYIGTSFIFKGKIEYIDEEITTGNEQNDEILNSLREYIKKLTAITQQLQQQKMRTVVQELNSITTSVLDFLVTNPQKAGRIRQFNNYFLPTTCKLLDSYIEMETQQNKGDNIKQSMNEIEMAMPGIKKSYQQIADDLNQDKVMDTAVEIEVLNRMIEQKTASDFQMTADGSDQVEK